MAVALDLPALGVLLICVVLMMLAWAYRQTLGAVLEALAGVFEGAVIKLPIVGRVGFQFLAAPIRSLDNHIRRILADGIAATEWAWHRIVQWNAYVLQETARAISDLSGATLAAVSGLVDRRIPTLIRAATRPLHSAVALLQRQAAALEHATAARIHGVTNYVTKEVTQRVTRVEKVTKIVVRSGVAAVATAGGLTAVLPRLWRGIDEAKGDAARLERGLQRVAGKLTVAGLAGLVAGVLYRTLRLSWLKCSNVERSAKHLCGIDHGLLDAILADTVAVFGTVSLVEFARAMQDGIVEADQIVRKFYRVV